MSGISIAELEHGFSVLERQFEQRRASLLARLVKQERLSPEDEHWLDNEGNLADERAILDVLSTASDLTEAVDGLTENQKAAFQRLRKAGAPPGAPVDKVSGGKRKRA